MEMERGEAKGASAGINLFGSGGLMPEMGITDTATASRILRLGPPPETPNLEIETPVGGI